MIYRVLMTCLVLYFAVACNGKIRKELEEQETIINILALEVARRPDIILNKPATITNYGNGSIYVTDNNMTYMQCYIGLSGMDCGTGITETFQYCDANDNSCNGGKSDGTLTGSGISELYRACDDLVLAGRSDWRVPTFSEIEFLYSYAFFYYPDDFPRIFSGSGRAWSSSSVILGAAYAMSTLGGRFLNNKTSANGIRCVAPGPTDPDQL